MFAEDCPVIQSSKMSSKGNLIEGKPPVLSTMSPPTTTLALNSDLNEFVCGWGAAIVNITITFPLNKIIFRQVLLKIIITIF